MRRDEIKRNLLWLIAVIVIIVTAILGIIVFNLPQSKPTKLNNDVSENSAKKSMVDKGKGTYDFAFETIYTGEPYLNSILFEFPFKKTSNYIENKVHMNEIGADNANILTTKTEIAAEALFNTAYKDDLLKKKDLLNETVTSGITVYYDNGIVRSGKKEVLDGFYNWFVNNKVSMESEFQTDKCMVYYDDYSEIVRGQLIFTIYECDNLEDIEKEFNIQNIELGTEYSVVLEFYYSTNEDVTDYDGYKLSGVNCL